jgi:hypothetical protein
VKLYWLYARSLLRSGCLLTIGSLFSEQLMLGYMIEGPILQELEYCAAKPLEHM